MQGAWSSLSFGDEPRVPLQQLSTDNVDSAVSARKRNPRLYYHEQNLVDGSIGPRSLRLLTVLSHTYDERLRKVTRLMAHAVWELRHHIQCAELLASFRRCASLLGRSIWWKCVDPEL